MIHSYRELGWVCAETVYWILTHKTKSKYVPKNRSNAGLCTFSD